MPEQEPDAMTYLMEEDIADQMATIESVNSEKRRYGAITCYQCRLCH
jgi:hypothetical protein